MRSAHSSTRRAGIGPLREARRKTLRFLLSRKVVASGFLIGCFIVLSVLLIAKAEEAWFEKPVGPMFIGFMLGAGLASVPWALWTLALMGDGSVSWRIGADGERWTANELSHLGREWRVEHCVPFPENGYPLDVDHVAIGPHGVFVVETKRTTRSIDLGAKGLHKEVRKAVQQAEDNAGRVRGLLRRVAEVDVIPVVVYWGRDVTPPAEPVRREGRVWIVAGKQAELWRPELTEQNLDAEAVATLWERLHGWVVEQDGKSVGSNLQRHLRRAGQLGRVSMASTAILIGLFPATRAWPDFDRILGKILNVGGGAVGVFALLMPLVLALTALALVHVGRRLEPTVPRTQGVAAMVLWCAAFGALLLAAP